MILEVKGTRTGGAEKTPAEKYVLKSDVARSKTPFVFGMALAAIGLYLRSIYKGTEDAGEVVPGQAALPARDKDAPADKQIVATLRPDPDVPTAPETEDATSAESAPPAAPGAPGSKPSMFPSLEGALGSVRGISFSHSTDLSRPANSEHAAGPGGFGGGSSAAGGSSRSSSSQGGGPGDLPTIDPEVPAPTSNGKPGSRPGDGDPSDGNTAPGSVIPTDVGTPPLPDGRPREVPGDGVEDGDRANRAPRVSGPIRLMDITACGLLMIGLDDLLAKASDPDGDILSITNVSVSGGMLSADGTGWIYRAPGMSLGPVTITYQVSDGALAVNQIATFSIVRPAPILGSDGDDLLIGSVCADEIDGGAGDDNIDARSGDDVIFGGDGDDHIIAGAGDDVVWGGNGRDIVFGGAGNDHIFGGGGNDRLYGEDGDDVIQGGDGDDYVSGGPGNDIVAGDAGKDELHDGDGSDVVSAGADNDRVVVAADGQTDTFDGGEGHDIIDFSAAARPLYVDLTAGVAVSSETGTDAIQGFEVVIGGAGDDTLKGSDRAEVLDGSTGNDRLFGFGGDDTLIGADGNDTLDGGSGDDRILDGGGADVVDAGAGDDTVVAAIDGDDDIYAGGEGFDVLDYSAATQALLVDLATGNAVGIEIGEDTISGFERLVGGSGDDHFVAGSQLMSLTGGAGQNVFEFRGEPNGGLIEAVHEILDFKHGDRIRLSKYDLFERAAEAFEDRFEAIYLGAEDDKTWIRYRHDDQDDKTPITRVEADFDGDDKYETTVLLSGHHMLAFIEHT